MAHLLYIESSPRKQRSASIEVAQAFLETYRAAHSSDTIDTLDVWHTPLPEFDGETLDAKYAGIAGVPLSPTQEQAWRTIRALAARIQRADKLVISVPMWNYTIPYKLKHFIDCVTQKDLLFTFDENGLNGLLTHRKAAIIYARGVEYNAAGLAPEIWDLQRQYLELWLRAIGVTDVATILVEKTLLGPDMDSAARDAAKKKAHAVAITF
ncbi:MAG: NAD(P)H-dependent oxidoreductase [Gammaproteobacteria bacterium]|nr:NAD(P)H-dependent oxidoreductase [Gammaproteobacteria bacterium]